MPGDQAATAKATEGIARVSPAGNLAAIGAMLLSTVFYTCSDAAMKFVSVVVPTGEAVFLRSLGTVLLLAIAAQVTGVLREIRQAFSQLMLVRGVADMPGIL